MTKSTPKKFAAAFALAALTGCGQEGSKATLRSQEALSRQQVELQDKLERQIAEERMQQSVFTKEEFLDIRAVFEYREDGIWATGAGYKVVMNDGKLFEFDTGTPLQVEVEKNGRKTKVSVGDCADEINAVRREYALQNARDGGLLR